MYNRGKIYDKGENGLRKNSKRAVQWELSAAQGYTAAQFNVAQCFCHGNGVAVDYKNAAKYFKQAADSGNAGAQNLLGHMYFAGEGVERDFGEAARLWEKAAEQGHEDAQKALLRIRQFGLRLT